MGLNSNLEVTQAVSRLQKQFRNICNTIKCCLGISSTGDETLFLNQKGQWTEAGSGDAWLLTGNAGVENTQFLGTTDGARLRIRGGSNTSVNKGTSISGMSKESFGIEIIGTSEEEKGIILSGTGSATDPTKADITLDSLNGKLSILNIGEGLDKILRSDANGFATWETISDILATLPSYANDAAASLGGLSVGDSYFSTGTSSYTRRLV